MNQELLTTAIAFFKDQHGTYESMKSQMLAGGIPQAEIDQIYEEIKRLGLDPTVKPVAVEAPAAVVAETVVTPAFTSIHPVSAEMITPNTVQQTTPTQALPSEPIATPSAQTTITPPQVIPSAPTPIPQVSTPVAPVVATPLNTFHGVTSVDTFTNPQTPTSPVYTRPEIPAIAPASSSSGNGLIIFMILFILIAGGAGGVFAYATYNPQSELAKIMSSTLENFGLIPPKPITVQKSQVNTTGQTNPTTTSQGVSVSATVLATSSPATTTNP